MRKIRFYFKRLREMDWSAFMKAIGYAHKKSGKSRIWLLFDMIRSSMRYTAGYVDYNEFEFYSLTEAQKATFMTVGKSVQIANQYNDKEAAAHFENKAEFLKRYRKFAKRDYIDLRETDTETFEAFLKKHGKVMMKRVDDYVGRGVSPLTYEEAEQEGFDVMRTKLIDNRQYLAEEFFKQHPKMNELAEKSVNTLRIITFLDDDGIPRVLVKVLKSGLGGFVDNIGQGGMYTILGYDGRVENPFVDKDNQFHTHHPITGKELLGFQVPFFDELIESVKEACLVEPKVRYVGWDVAVGVDGPEIIEGNAGSGSFQVIPSLSNHKTGVRPIYQKYIKGA